MSVFVDTGVLFADYNHRDRHHQDARAAMETMATGRLGAGLTSSFVYDEAVTLMLSRTNRFEDAKTIGDRILGRDPYPDIMTLLHVDGPRFRQALEVFERYSDHGLSFTDATTVAIVEERGIDAVLSFDDGFDGIVERVEPGEVDG